MPGTLTKLAFLANLSAFLVPVAAAAQEEPLHVDGLKPTRSMVWANDRLVDAQRHTIAGRKLWNDAERAHVKIQQDLAGHMDTRRAQQDEHDTAFQKYRADRERLIGGLDGFLAQERENLARLQGEYSANADQLREMLSALEASNTAPDESQFRQLEDMQAKSGSLADQIEAANAEINKTITGLNTYLDAQRAALDVSSRALSDSSIAFWDRKTTLDIAVSTAAYDVQQLQVALAAKEHEEAKLSHEMRVLLLQYPPNALQSIEVLYYGEDLVYAADYAATGESLALNAEEKQALARRIIEERETLVRLDGAIDEASRLRTSIRERLTDAHKRAAVAEIDIANSVLREKIALLALEIGGTVATAYLTAGTGVAYVLIAENAAEVATKTLAKGTSDAAVDLGSEAIHAALMIGNQSANATMSKMANFYIGETLTDIQKRLGVAADIDLFLAPEFNETTTLLSGELVEMVQSEALGALGEVGLDWAMQKLGRVKKDIPSPSTLATDMSVLAAKAGVVYAEAGFRDQSAIDLISASTEAVLQSQNFDRVLRTMGRLRELRTRQEEFIVALDQRLQHGRPRVELQTKQDRVIEPEVQAPMTIKVTFVDKVDGIPLLRSPALREALGRQVDDEGLVYQFDTVVTNPNLENAPLQFGFSDSSRQWTLLDTDPTTIPHIGSLHEAAWDNVEAGVDTNHVLRFFEVQDPMPLVTNEPATCDQWTGVAIAGLLSDGSGHYYQDKAVDWASCLNFNPVTKTCMDKAFPELPVEACLNGRGEVLLNSDGTFMTVLDVPFDDPLARLCQTDDTCLDTMTESDPHFPGALSDTLAD